MAISPRTRYPGQITTTDPAYPQGKAQNETTPNDGTGTPLEKDLVNDIFGFQQALLAAAAITPTGTPDKVGASQYLDGIRSVIAAAVTPTQAKNWPERASVPTSGVSNNSDVPIAWLSSGGYFGSSIFCASGDDQYPYTSEDGILWTRRTSFSGPFMLNSPVKDLASGLVGGSVGFLASGTGNGNLAQSTTGGISWTLTGSGIVPTSSVLCYADSLSLWVAAGASGAISTSPDGTTWTTRTTPAAWILNSGGAKRVVWNGSLFVILPLNTYSKFLTSPDGVTWTERTVTSATWTGLAYSPTDGIWMACATTTGAVWKSTNGTAWTDTGVSLGFTLNDLAVNKSLWVAATSLGYLGGVAWSIDQGATWNAVAVGNHRLATAGFKRLLFGDSRFVAVHAVGTGAVLEFALSARSN